MISEADTKTTESECNRILFVEKRDGVAEAIQFVKRTPYRDWETDRKSTRLNSSHSGESRMPSSA